MTHGFSRLPVVPVLLLALLGGYAAHEMAGDGSRRALATEVEAHLMSKLDVWYPRVSQIADGQHRAAAALTQRPANPTTSLNEKDP